MSEIDSDISWPTTQSSPLSEYDDRIAYKYMPSIKEWSESADLAIVTTDGKELLTFAIDFLRGTETGTWQQYVYFILDACYFVECPNQHRLVDVDGQTLDQQPLLAGTYTLLGSKPAPKPELYTTLTFLPRYSPTYWARAIDEQTDFGFSEHVEFIRNVKNRDEKCLISGREAYRCYAFHIVPWSRPDLFRAALGYDPPDRQSTKFGILLSSDMALSFSFFEIGFWPAEDDELIIHVFCDRFAHQYHGKVIEASTFRGNATDRPDRTLLAFHYRQCAMRRLRPAPKEWIEGASGSAQA